MERVKLRRLPKVLKELRKIDEARKERDRVRNDLESFVFSSRDRLRTYEDDVALVASEEAVEKIFEDLENTEEWIDDDSDDAEVKEFLDRKAALSKVVNGIFERVGEIKQRPRAVAMAKKTLKLAKSKLKTLRVDRPWISTRRSRSPRLRLIACTTG